MGKDYRPSKCLSCGAGIMWVKTSNGKNMPIDYDPDLEHEFVGGKGTRPDFDRERMTSHFETCPFAENHRS